MSNTSQREIRRIASEAKLAREVQQYSDFIVRVVSPLFAHLHIDSSTRGPTLSISAREIENEYGSASAKCFKLLFKLLQRGGRDKNGIAFKSAWVINDEALQPFVEYNTSKEEKLTSAGLLKALNEASVCQLEWYKPLSPTARKMWISTALRNTKMASRRLENKENKKKWLDFQASKAAERNLPVGILAE